MGFLTQMDPKILEALAKFGTFLFTVVSGLAAAIWTVVRFLNEKRQQREQQKHLELMRLEQQRLAEKGRRAERVANLMSEYSKAKTPHMKVWNLLALSLYPHETTRLLTMSLGQVDDESARGVEFALVAIGKDALPELIRLNRMAQLFYTADNDPVPNGTPPVYDTEKLLCRTKTVIRQLLVHLSREEILEHDLSELDLSECSFQGMSLQGLEFRKCNLSRTVFKRANLRSAKFRGALLEGTNFLGASLNDVDFTGAIGAIIAIKAFPEDACFGHAKMAGSNFDGSSLRGASFQNAHMEESSFRGAKLHGCSASKSYFDKIDGTKMKVAKASMVGSKFVRAVLSEATLSECRFERCKMMGLSASNLNARLTKFLNCNLGGSDMRDSDLTGAEFRGCVLGGVDFRGCVLIDTVFHNCDMDTAKFDD